VARITKEEEKSLMRVLHVFKTFAPDTYGGIEQVVKILASHTQALGIENRVVVLTAGQPREDIEPAGFAVRRYKQDLYLASTGFSLSMLSNFSREAAWADIMHMHFPWPFADMCYLTSRVNKPSVLSYHSDVVNQPLLNKLYAPLRDQFFSKMSVICAASPAIMKSSPVLQKFQDKTQLITYGIEHFPQLALEDQAAQAWQQRYGPRFFLFLGGLRYYKGLHVLLDALQGRDYPTVIVGKGREQEALRAQAKALRLKNVHFIDEVDDTEKRSLMRAAYGFVFPSHLSSEAFGIVLVEAAQQGLPMISCEIGTGTSYVNKDNQTGLVVAPSDPTAFRAALDVFWENSEQTKSWGEGALKRYLEHFRAQTMAERYVDTYKSVLR
jgi:glycosyltransferase involved in cell wall biosynthesis